MTEHQPSQPELNSRSLPSSRKSCWRCRLKWLLAIIAVALIAGELIARFYLGLGDPPLSVFDAEMEYRFKPSMTYHRFGHLIHYNAYSMRSNDFPEHKADSRELRVLVIGDSVINGGSLLDQSEICTSILQTQLSHDLQRPVIVGNISAGSWGPPNELAYIKRYGLFDADVVVLVLSSHDATDVMTFEPTVGVKADFPDRAPKSALWEGIARYVPGYWAKITHAPLPEPTTAPTRQQVERDQAICAAATREMIDRIRASGARVIMAQHMERPELQEATPREGHELFLHLATSMEVEPIQLGESFRQAIGSGQAPYRDHDDIHPSALGESLIAQSLLPAIEKAAAK